MYKVRDIAVRNALRCSLRASICALLCVVATLAQADAIDRFVQAQLARHHVPGLALAVVRDGRVVRAQGYGLADIERGVRVTPETVFEIGSITKQFTAVALMLLVEQGKLALDDPIASRIAPLPNFPTAWQGVTLRQLLTHTSSIPDYEEIMSYSGYRNPMTPRTGGGGCGNEAAGLQARRTLELQQHRLLPADTGNRAGQRPAASDTSTSCSNRCSARRG